MLQIKIFRKSTLYVVAIIFSLAISSCKSNPAPVPQPPDPRPVPPVPKLEITENMLKLEAEHPDLLAPILSLKVTTPKTYWFIVSWLKTNYKTPDWTNYGSDTWQKQAKIKGIDCSGLARVMHDQVFGYKIAGSSRGLLSKYSKEIKRSTAKMGDLVFFKTYKSESNRITHIGVYLMDNYFVHATSTKSAAKGLGLNVSSLEDKRWNDDLVAVGRVKDEFLKKEM
ncbi:MAG: hypothetical protein ACJAVE_001192 [Polaribacter sp.]|jgi:hypothetical protein